MMMDYLGRLLSSNIDHKSYSDYLLDIIFSQYFLRGLRIVNQRATKLSLVNRINGFHDLSTFVLCTKVVEVQMWHQMWDTPYSPAYDF